MSEVYPEGRQHSLPSLKWAVHLQNWCPGDSFSARLCSHSSPVFIYLFIYFAFCLFDWLFGSWIQINQTLIPCLLPVGLVCKLDWFHSLKLNWTSSHGPNWNLWSLYVSIFWFSLVLISYLMPLKGGVTAWLIAQPCTVTGVYGQELQTDFGSKQHHLHIFNKQNNMFICRPDS